MAKLKRSIMLGTRPTKPEELPFEGKPTVSPADNLYNSTGNYTGNDEYDNFQSRGLGSSFGNLGDLSRNSASPMPQQKSQAFPAQLPAQAAPSNQSSASLDSAQSQNTVTQANPYAQEQAELNAPAKKLSRGKAFLLSMLQGLAQGNGDLGAAIGGALGGGISGLAAPGIASRRADMQHKQQVLARFAQKKAIVDAANADAQARQKILNEQSAITHQRTMDTHTLNQDALHNKQFDYGQQKDKEHFEETKRHNLSTEATAARNAGANETRAANSGAGNRVTPAEAEAEAQSIPGRNPEHQAQEALQFVQQQMPHIKSPADLASDKEAQKLYQMQLDVIRRRDAAQEKPVRSNAKAKALAGNRQAKPATNGQQSRAEFFKRLGL